MESAPHAAAAKKRNRPVHLVQASLQTRGAHFLRHVPVRRVGQKELSLGVQGGLDVLLAVDVLLTAIHNSNITWKERNRRHD